MIKDVFFDAKTFILPEKIYISKRKTLEKKGRKYDR